MTRLRMAYAVITVVLAGLAVHTTIGAQQSQEETSGSKLRVGTFDSRALAVAYYRSEAFRRHMGDLRAEYEKAKATGDEKHVKALEAESANPSWPDSGWPPSAAQQDLIHKQGFSTWPVDNVLERIKGKMRDISKQADVQLIVSRWDVVYPRSGSEFVDVTDLMVKLFDPDEETLKITRQIQKQAPIPPGELHHDD